MATLKLIIRAKRKNKSGKTNIYIRYTHNEKSFLISTNEKVNPDHWNEIDQVVKPAHGKGFSKLNDKLRIRIGEIDKIRLQEELKGHEPTIDHIRNLLDCKKSTDKERKKSFFEHLEEYIEEKKGHVSIYALKHFITLKNHLKAFSKNDKYNIELSNIDNSFYLKFLKYCYDIGMNNNTAGCQIKELKTFLNYLTRKGINEKLDYQYFKKPSAPVDIIYCTSEDLEKIKKADLSKNKKLEKIRDLFLIGCYTGLRYADYSQIRPENIKEKYLAINVRKTNEPLRIPLTDPAKLIIANYPEGVPSISNQKFNEYLKILGKVAKLNEDIERVSYSGPNEKREIVKKHQLLSSHCARRTFITQSLERGLRPEVLMRITGHKDVKMLMKYVKITEKVVENEMFDAWNNNKKIT